jgi:serine/threonine protein kinase
MEFCEMNNYRINKTLDLLKNKLSLLHAFNIVHLDIKPENIAYCPTYN